MVYPMIFHDIPKEVNSPWHRFQTASSTNDKVKAVEKLLPEYHARYQGPVAAGSPPTEDAEAVMPGAWKCYFSWMNVIENWSYNLPRWL